MSRTAVEQVIGKLVLDASFRTTVASDPNNALSGYDLTSEERQAFTQLDMQEFGQDIRALDERLSKAYRVWA